MKLANINWSTEKNYNATAVITSSTLTDENDEIVLRLKLDVTAPKWHNGETVRISFTAKEWFAVDTLMGIMKLVGDQDPVAALEKAAETKLGFDGTFVPKVVSNTGYDQFYFSFAQ